AAAAVCAVHAVHAGGLRAARLATISFANAPLHEKPELVGQVSQSWQPFHYHASTCAYAIVDGKRGVERILIPVHLGQRQRRTGRLVPRPVSRVPNQADRTRNT